MRTFAKAALTSVISLCLMTGIPAAAKTVGVAETAMPDTRTAPPTLAERALKPGHSLVVQERVTTGAMGPAQLLMQDQSTVTESRRSELTIDAFVYDPDTRTGQMAINLTHGLLRYVGGRISKNGAVNIETPVATMGVRGGIAHVNVLSDTVVEVTLVYGDWIKGETTSGQSFELTRAGEFTRIELGELPSPPVIIAARAIREAALALGADTPGALARRRDETRQNREAINNTQPAHRSEGQDRSRESSRRSRR